MYVDHGRNCELILSELAPEVEKFPEAGRSAGCDRAPNEQQRQVGNLPHGWLKLGCQLGAME